MSNAGGAVEGRVVMKVAGRIFVVVAVGVVMCWSAITVSRGVVPELIWVVSGMLSMRW